MSLHRSYGFLQKYRFNQRIPQWYLIARSHELTGEHFHLLNGGQSLTIFENLLGVSLKYSKICPEDAHRYEP